MSTEQTKPETEESVEYLRRAAESRLAADRKLSMNERLAALHELCKQVASIDGAAKRTMKQVAARPQDKADLEYLPESDPD